MVGDAGKALVCPLFVLQPGVPERLKPLFSRGMIIEDVACIKSNCAWWDDNLKLCSIKSITINLGYLRTLSKK